MNILYAVITREQQEYDIFTILRAQGTIRAALATNHHFWFGTRVKTNRFLGMEPSRLPNVITFVLETL